MTSAEPRPTVLLTGATGFVGAHAARALDASGWRVRALLRAPDRPRPAACEEAAVADVRDAAALRRALRGVDGVVHLAARVSDAAPRDLHAVNVEGTRALCEAMRLEAPAARLVFVSSAAAVGPSRDGAPLREDAPPRPVTPYGESKLAAERVVRDARMSAVCLRPPLVVGEGARGLRPLRRLARAGVVPMPAGEAQPISVLDVHDLARYCAAALRAEEGCFHVASPTASSFPALVEALGAILGRRVRRVAVPRWCLRGAATAAVALGRVAWSARLEVLLARAWVLDARRAAATLGPCAENDLHRALRALALDDLAVGRDA